MKDLTQFALLGLASAAHSAGSISSDPSVSTTLSSFNVTRGAACACQKLSKSSGGVIFPHSASYTVETEDRYWDVRCDLSPACVFLPATANEVTHALKVFDSCEAPFAVRGGGHMNVSPA